MQEYQPRVKKKIWRDKLSSSEIDTLTTESLETLDQVLTLKEKDLKPFWMKQSKEISEKLLLPTKIDYVDSVLSSSKASLNPSLNPPQMGESWFSIDKKKIQKNKSCNTSLPLSQFSLPNSMGYEVMESKKEYKTLKIRILPNEEERKIIDRMEGQFRWYYNTALAICRKEHPGLKTYTKLSSTSFRDTVMKYDYKEQEEINTVAFERTTDQELTRSQLIAI